MKNERGFTAIELLITLIVGMMLLFSAYQLYSVVIQSSKDASRRANASIFAYQLIRENSYLATYPCTSATLSNVTIPASANLPTGSTANVQLACVTGNTSLNLTKISAIVTYGTGNSVVHATYIKKG